MPAIIVFIAAIVDFGIAIDRRLALQHAVREGARYAAVHEDLEDICDRTAAQAQNIIDPDDVTVTYTGADGIAAGDPGSSVTVSASFEYEFLVLGPVLDGLFGEEAASIVMEPSGTARLERSVDVVLGCNLLTPEPPPL
jgi:hypothetical protein